MSFEQHCKNCGAVDATETRQRCDGCGRLLSNEEHMGHLVLPDPHDHYRQQNPIGLCSECLAKVHVPQLLCARCEHPRHLHNVACMVVFDRKTEDGYNVGCDCPGFILAV